VHPLFQKFDFTYLSDNIEEHAKPNNVAYYTNPQQLHKSLHPFLQSIPKSTLEEDDISILREYTKLGCLIETDTTFDRLIGFPRLLIQIKDKQLAQLSRTTNQDHYEYIKTLGIHKAYMDTINNIKVREIQDDTPPKTGFVKILGTGILNHNKDIMMYGKNKQTLFAAAKRQMKTAPVPSSKVTKQFLQYAINRIENELGPYLDNFSYDEAQWFSHLSAPKQRAITPIRTYYKNDGMFHLLYSIEEQQRILTTHYEAIVKAELQPADGKPRMVCSIPQRIKYTMGPVCWQLEEICAKHLNGYCGGMNLTEMADKINALAAQGFTKVVEGDGSAFDNSQDITLKALDRYIYNRIASKVYHVPQEEFKKLSNLYYKTMDVKYHCNGKPKTYMTYKVLGTVFSGDSDTTLANTIRMAMYNIFVNEISGLKYGDDFVVFSKGDDFSVLYKERISNDFIRSIYSKYFLSKPEGEFKVLDNRQGGLGQICKFLEIGGLDSFKFCSLRSWYIDNTYERITLTRNPAKLYTLAQYSIKAKNKKPAALMQYHLDLATSYEMSYKGIEIFEVMAKAHRDHAAYIYNHYHNDPSFKKSFKSIYNKLLKEKQRESVVDFGFSQIYNLKLQQLMDIKGRDNYEDLVYAQYWDNMQAKYNIRTEVNNKEELKYINDQINAEFDVEELKSLVGETNF